MGSSSVAENRDSGSSSGGSSSSDHLGCACPKRRADTYVAKSRLHNVEDAGSMFQTAKLSESEAMKEMFAKLLLGQDMSGGGKGVSPALAISNAITNLCATVFGQLSRLEQLQSEKKLMWEREMQWLVSVSAHIVELMPSWQTSTDGSDHEVMTCRPRSDLSTNLPALGKLDSMLLEILDGFSNTEFWYVDKGSQTPEFDGMVPQKQGKWWLPVPRVPPGGLSEATSKELKCKRECASQIHKAAMAINSVTLAEMEVPHSYLETLPKNAKACLGDVIYRHITSEHFSTERSLDCLDLSHEHLGLEVMNRVEAAIYLWHKRHAKSISHPNRSSAKSSWEIVKDLVKDGEKSELFSERASSLLLRLKQRLPFLTQTSLDSSKIQFNKDVGKSILESYSRVLESLAFNIMARIDDLLFIDSISKKSRKTSSIPSTISMVGHKMISSPYSMTLPSTPYRTSLTTPDFSPARLFSPARSHKTPNVLGGKCNKTPQRCGFGVKRVLTNYLDDDDAKVKSCGDGLVGKESPSIQNELKQCSRTK